MRNRNPVSPDARVVRFCRFGDRQACKTPVLWEITNLWLNTSPFQWRLHMSPQSPPIPLLATTLCMHYPLINCLVSVQWQKNATYFHLNYTATCFCSVFAYRTTIPVWLYDWITRPNFGTGDRAIMSVWFQLTSTFNATWTDSPQPPSGFLFTTRCCACGDKQPCIC